MFDLFVSGGVVVTPTGPVPAGITVAGEKIAALVPPGEVVDATQVIDASGRFVLPGLIDSHVHFRTPGLTHKEDWAHGSRAAVAGGITTVIDMPNTAPPLLHPRDAHTKHLAIQGTSLVDYRFHAGCDPHSIESVNAFTEREAVSVKIFLSGHHTAHQLIRSDAELSQVFQLAAKYDKVVICHSEDDALVATDPRRAAIASTTRLIDLADKTGVRTHILHVSSEQEVNLIVEAVNRGVPISFEVTGHHLTFVETDTWLLGAKLRLRPPIRGEADRQRLWRAVLSGEALTLGSDHAPHTVAEKNLPGDSAPPGLPGVQELLPAFYSGLTDQGLDPPEAMTIVARMLAEAPGRLFRLDNRKGRIAAGMDADLVVFDPDGASDLEPESIHSKCKWTAYQGRKLIGAVERTIRRGRLAYSGGGSNVEFGEPLGLWL